MQSIPRPTDERVILQPLPPEETTAGGLFIPQTGRKRTHRGRVLAVGRGKVTERGVRVDPSFQVGDVVIYSEWNNEQRVLNDPDGPVVLLIDDVLAVVE